MREFSSLCRVLLLLDVGLDFSWFFLLNYGRSICASDQFITVYNLIHIEHTRLTVNCIFFVCCNCYVQSYFTSRFRQFRLRICVAVRSKMQISKRWLILDPRLSFLFLPCRKGREGRRVWDCGWCWLSYQKLIFYVYFVFKQGCSYICFFSTRFSLKFTKFTFS